MTPTGKYFVGASEKTGSGAAFRATDPLTGAAFGPEYLTTTQADLDAACTLADAAFDPYRQTPPATRAAFLDGIADQIDQLGAALIQTASHETGLPEGRIEGERNRTTGQLRMFAQLLRSGTPIEAHIVPADPARAPLPRPDLRRQFIGVGPVAVFGASNFPLAFSVAGGDTASALAAGCPVVVKAHPAHPGTSELAARAILAAARELDLHPGVFSMVAGAGHETGAQLVAHPAIKSVAFTGSQKGGLALMQIAQARPEPIPVHAEMGSVNPVFLMPAALAARSGSIAQGFVASLTASAGQFCTNPGLVIAVQSPALDQFFADLQAQISDQDAQPMLTPAIHGTYEANLARWQQTPAVEVIARGTNCGTLYGSVPTVLRVLANAVADTAGILDENFGASAVVVVCQTVDEMLDIARGLDGQLTATLQHDPADEAPCRALIPVLERKAGRIVSNGWPTGVEVNAAIVHGGPFPSSSDGRTTSVGPLAIRRFLRPVAYQNLPQSLLPEPLQDANPWHLPQQRS